LSEQVISQTILAHPVFSGLTRQEADELSQRCDIFQLGAGEVLFHQGHPSGDLYMVLSGGLRMTFASPDGVQVVVGTVDAGGIVGEMGVFDVAPRSATATTRSETSVMHLPGESFTELISIGHPAAQQLLRWVRRQVCVRLRRLNDRLDAVFEPPSMLGIDEPTSELSSERARTLWEAFSQETR